MKAISFEVMNSGDQSFFINEPNGMTDVVNSGQTKTCSDRGVYSVCLKDNVRAFEINFHDGNLNITKGLDHTPPDMSARITARMN